MQDVPSLVGVLWGEAVPSFKAHTRTLVILNQQSLLYNLLFLSQTSAGRRAVLELMLGWHPRVGGGSSKFTAME